MLGSSFAPRKSFMPVYVSSFPTHLTSQHSHPQQVFSDQRSAHHDPRSRLEVKEKQRQLRNARTIRSIARVRRNLHLSPNPRVLRPQKPLRAQVLNPNQRHPKAITIRFQHLRQALLSSFGTPPCPQCRPRPPQRIPILWPKALISRT